jgi:hypothetical protein
MKYIKKFENLYNNSNIKFDVEDDSEIEEINLKLNIINKYFPFNEVSGTVSYTNGIVYLIFNNGEFIISGKYDEKTETQPSIFLKNEDEITFNFHKFSKLSGADLKDFENEIKNIKDNIDKYTICVENEGYAIFNMCVVDSLEEAIKKIDDYKISIVKGSQVEGKIINKTIKEK